MTQGWKVPACLAVALAICGGVVACGSERPNAGSATSVEPVTLDFANPTVVAGSESFLLIDHDGPPYRVLELRPTKAGLERSSVASLPGESVTDYHDGLQLEDGRWVVLGRWCDLSGSIEKDCEVGDAVVAVLGAEAKSWTVHDAVPDELTDAYVAIVGGRSSGILLERWNEGDSSLWLLDVDDGSFRSLAWQPPALALDIGVGRANEEIFELQPDRERCLAGEQLLVVDGEPIPGGMRSHVWVVDLDSGADALRREGDLDLLPSVVQHSLVCRPDGRAYLIAIDQRDNRPGAYQLEDAAVTDSLLSSASGDRFQYTANGPSSVTMQLNRGEVHATGTTAIAGEPPPASPVTTRRASLPRVETVAFLDGTWMDITRLVGLNERAVFAENAPYALVAKEHKTFRAIRVP